MAQRDNPFEGSTKIRQRKARTVRALADIRRRLAKAEAKLEAHTGSLAVLAKADEALAGSIHGLVAAKAQQSPDAMQAKALRSALQLCFEFEVLCGKLLAGESWDRWRVHDLVEGSKHLRRSTP